MQKQRKKNGEEVAEQKKAELWKRPVKPRDEPVPFVSFEHLRPLDDAEKFMREFPDQIEGKLAITKTVIKIMTRFSCL